MDVVHRVIHQLHRLLHGPTTPLPSPPQPPSTTTQCKHHRPLHWSSLPIHPTPSTLEHIHLLHLLLQALTHTLLLTLLHILHRLLHQLQVVLTPLYPTHTYPHTHMRMYTHTHTHTHMYPAPPVRTRTTTTRAPCGTCMGHQHVLPQHHVIVVVVAVVVVGCSGMTVGTVGIVVMGWLVVSDTQPVHHALHRLLPALALVVVVLEQEEEAD